MKSPARLIGDQLSFEYAGRISGLREASIEISPGDRLALVGQNGSGKTTLAKLLAGLLEPASGHVLLGDRDLKSIPPAELARSIGFVFQNPDHQIFSPTVRQEIAFGPGNLGLSEHQIAERTEKMLAQFELVPFADHPPAALSFGLRRKVSVASVFAMDTPFLILDEPTLGLDWRTATQLMDLVVRSAQETKAILFISHDLRLVARYAKETSVLHQGELVARGQTNRILLDRELLMQVGLAAPPIVHLAAALTDHGFPDNALHVAGFVEAVAGMLEGER
ncbi:MAG: energy-coupling factor ABC transporter ATP-binding protein [Anaerolineales bacterium]